MVDDDLEQALALQGRITAFVRAFGLHQPDHTPCGTPVPTSEAHAIGELDRDGPLTQSVLGERLRLEKSTVSRLVSQLTARGWVKRVDREGDARLVWLDLTSDGRRAAGELAVARAARFADLLRSIPAAQRPTVIAALTTLVEAANGQPTALDQG